MARVTAQKLMADTPQSGDVGPGIHTHDTTTGLGYVEGMQVDASLAGDAEVGYLFECPNGLPTGTMKLAIWHIADATTGNAIVNPSWAAADYGTDLGALTLSAEGNSTISHSAGNDDKIREMLITLDSATLPTAGQLVVVRLKLESTGWTLAQTFTFGARLIWE